MKLEENLFECFRHNQIDLRFIAHKERVTSGLHKAHFLIEGDCIFIMFPYAQPELLLIEYLCGFYRFI